MSRLRLALLCGALLALIVFLPTCGAANVSPAADAWVSGETGDGYGFDNLQVSPAWESGGASGPEFRALIKFQVPPNPPHQLIQSAKLWLYCYALDSPFYIQARKQLSTSWTEEGVNWNNQPSYSESYVERYVESTGWHSWDVTADVVPDATVGWTLMSTDIAGARVVAYFRSRENDTHSPYLEIVYYNPSPEVLSITCDNSIVVVPRGLGDPGATRIVARVRDNSGRDDISAVKISVRGADDAILVENVSMSLLQAVDENVADYYYVYSPPENLPLASRGRFDVQVIVEDGGSNRTQEPFTGKGHELFEVWGAYYSYYLRWEENQQPANVSGTIIAYMPSSTQENAITGQLENVRYIERPTSVRLNYGSYFRSLIPAKGFGPMYFYVTDSPNLQGYLFELLDYTGLYGPPAGSLHIQKQVGTSLFTIHESRWSFDLTTVAYLIQNGTYNLTVKGSGITRNLGPYTVTTSPITIRTADVEIPEPSEIWRHIEAVAWRDNDKIKLYYHDNSFRTISARVGVYDSAMQLRYLAEFENNEFLVIYLSENENDSYFVTLDVQHENGSFTFTWPIEGQLPPSLELPDIETVLGIPMSFLGSIAFVLVVALAMAFDAARAPLAGVAIALAVAMFWYMGWLPLNVYTVTLLVVIAVIALLGWRWR